MGNHELNKICARCKQAREEKIDPVTKKSMTQEEAAREYPCSISFISATETGAKSPGRKVLKRLGEIYDKSISWFLGEDISESATSDPPLSESIPVVRTIKEESGGYRVVAYTERLIRVKVLDIATLPDDFKSARPLKYIEIRESDLDMLTPKNLDNVFAIELSTELGLEWGINLGDFVIMDRYPPKVDSEFYLVTVQSKMVFRHITWKPPTLIDNKGIKTPFNEQDMKMSGRIIKVQPPSWVPKIRV